MDNVSIIGIDISKSSFQVHGATVSGKPALRKKLSRGKMLEFFASQSPCLVVMEACGGAHYWGREIQQLGHEVKLIAPAYVKPFVKRQSYQDTSLRHSNSMGFCPGSDADGNVPSIRARATAADPNASADITHGAPLRA